MKTSTQQVLVNTQDFAKEIAELQVEIMAAKVKKTAKVVGFITAMTAMSGLTLFFTVSLIANIIKFI